jgi:hypothetical protein
VLLGQPNLYCAHSFILLTDLNDLRAAVPAPSPHNRMNASAAHALNVQCAAHRVGFAPVAFLCCLIFDDHDGIHRDVTTDKGFFKIAPAWKEEERPARTDATGLWNRGSPTMTGRRLKRKATRSMLFAEYPRASPAPRQKGLYVQTATAVNASRWSNTDILFSRESRTAVAALNKAYGR